MVAVNATVAAAVVVVARGRGAVAGDVAILLLMALDEGMALVLPLCTAPRVSRMAGLEPGADDSFSPLVPPTEVAGGASITASGPVPSLDLAQWLDVILVLGGTDANVWHVTELIESWWWWLPSPLFAKSEFVAMFMLPIFIVGSEQPVTLLKVATELCSSFLLLVQILLLVLEEALVLVFAGFLELVLASSSVDRVTGANLTPVTPRLVGVLGRLVLLLLLLLLLLP